MKGTKSAGRYALALTELAIESGKLEEVKTDMELVAATIAENHELELMLHSPIIKLDKKQKALHAIFEKSIEPLSLGFIELVCAKGREAAIPAMASSFVQQYKDRKGIVTAEVTSAVALTDEQRKEVTASLASLGEQIELNERVDASILGGMKVKVGDRRVDASLRKKINELKYDIHNS